MYKFLLTLVFPLVSFFSHLLSPSFHFLPTFFSLSSHLLPLSFRVCFMAEEDGSGVMGMFMMVSGEEEEERGMVC